MRFRRRPFSIFTLSFLDVMCCGFGAVVLLFMLLKHEAIVNENVQTIDLAEEIARLNAQLDGSRSSLDRTQREASAADAELTALVARSQAARAALAAAKATPEARAAAPVTRRDIAALKVAIHKLEMEKRQLLSELNARSKDVRAFAGVGKREYLTGMKMGGRRTLILLDVSASMLDETIVNVLRRRNMDDESKRRSEKWQQAIDTVDWLAARLPPGSEYQIYVFNSTAAPALAASAGRWLSTENKTEFNQVIAATRQRLPEGGSNLARAMQVIGELQPQADNVFLITDGLPTMGLAASRGGNVSGNERMALFEEARALMPSGTPVNVILLPMEGDPMAPWAYWGMAVYTHGSFLTPAYDWP